MQALLKRVVPERLSAWSQERRARRAEARAAAVQHPFRVMVEKEISDHVRSWRFIILLALMALTCVGSLYSAVQSIGSVDPTADELRAFVFLKLFTLSDGTLPSFITFISFLGPLIGLGLGFDAINSERNKGTLSRLMSQPIHRDYVIAAKFVAALAVIAIMFFALGFMVMGTGLINIGIPPTPEEFMRMILFLLLSVVYVAFWLCLAIVFSVRLRQPATSALSGIAVWIFFAVFYSLILNLVSNALKPASNAAAETVMRYQQFMLLLERLSPSYLFNEATTTLLMPSVRTVGLLSQEQIAQLLLAVNAPLPLGQSLLLVWPQLTCLVAATAILFAVAYRLFMRQEIRSRS